MHQHLYHIKDTQVCKDVSYVGVIDGSGSMSPVWEDLCKAWNYYIQDNKNSFCIQFDDKAVLQKSAKLLEQMGEDTNIEEGFKQLTELIKSKQVTKNVEIVFVTDGVGKEDKVENFIGQIQQDFKAFQNEGYNFRFRTLAVGEEFSPQIVVELKHAIHNSGSLVPLLDVITNSKVDFMKKLQYYKDQPFYQMCKLDHSVQISPVSNPVEKVSGDQVILCESPLMKINGKQVNVEKQKLTFPILDMFIRQTLIVIIEQSLKGDPELKEKSLKSVQLIEHFRGTLSLNEQQNGLIDQNIRLIEKIANTELNFQQMNTGEMAQVYEQLLQNNILRVQQKPRRVTKQVEPTQKIDYVDYYREMAEKRIEEYQQMLQNNELFEEISDFVEENRGKTLEQLWHIINTYDFPYKKIKEYILPKDDQIDQQKLDELMDIGLDVIDLYMIKLY